MSSSSASVHGTSGAEYLNLLLHTMCMVGTIWLTRYWWCLAMPTSSLVASTTCRFSATRPGEAAGPFFRPTSTMLARTPRYGKLSSAGRRVRGLPLYRISSVGSSSRAAKSYAVMTDLISLIRIPDQAQKSDTTCKRRDMPEDDSQTSVRSSANPLAGLRSPDTIRTPTPQALRASRRALNSMLKSRGDSLSPCLLPRVKGTAADLPYGRSAA